MPHTPLITALLLTMAPLGVVAQTTTTQPTTQPATAAEQSTASTQSVATKPEAVAAAHRWLGRIEQRAGQIDTLRAKLRYERTQGLLGDSQVRFGTLAYSAGPPKHFAIHFDRLVVNRQLEQRDKWFIFDGRWLAERDHRRNMFVRRELVPAGERGDQMLELGGGPFIIPLDLERKQVLERFNVRRIHADAKANNADADGDTGDEQPDTVHLRLTPRPNVDVKQKQLDVWYDKQTVLPVKVAGREKGQDSWTVRLMDVETGIELDDDVFNTQPPEGDDWQIEIKPLEE